MSNWVTVKKLTKLYTFEFNKSNNYTIPIPKDIKNFNINNLIISMGNIQSYLNILGYSLKPYVVDNSIKVDITMDILNKAGERINAPHPDEDGVITMTWIGGASFDLYDTAKFIQFFLSSHSFSGFIASTFTNVYINGVFYKKFLNLPDSYNFNYKGGRKVQIFNTIMDIDLTEITNSKPINNIELKFFSINNDSSVLDKIEWGYLFGDCLVTSAYTIIRDTKNDNLEFNINGYYLEEL